MAFKIKDLMITVLAGKGAAPAEKCEESCPLFSCDLDSGGCDDLSNACAQCTDAASGDCGDCSDFTCDGTDCGDCTVFSCAGCSDPTCACSQCSQCSGCTCSVCTGGCTACSQCSKCSACTCTKCTAHSVCTLKSLCTACSHLQSCGASVIKPTSRLRTADLPRLKAQLQQALKRVEARQEAAAKKMQPRSLEEIEMLEEKLRQALDELARQKKELPAKGTTGGAATEKKNQKGEKKS
jgi:hypothetical protein